MVLSILDSMPHRVVNAEVTPNLFAQVTAGGRAPDGGRSLPMSVTYSNHAAFVTGVGPETTGLWGNKAWIDDGFVRTWQAGPRAATLFERCSAAGLVAMVAVGDQKLGPTMGTPAASMAWPPTVDVPPGIAVDALGYPADSAVLDVVAGWDLAAADFLLVHLNEPDTTMHLYGPTSEEAQAQYRESDAAYGRLVELLQPAWHDTVLITISDHEQEPITHPECVDLGAALAHRDATVAHDGTGAIVVGAIETAEILAIDGVEGVAADPHHPHVRIAWTDPGRMFGVGEPLARGNHGSPRCATQVAIVSGGHPAVPGLARGIESTRPTSLTWAPLIASLLGL